jgi:hypothetical protein
MEERQYKVSWKLLNAFLETVRALSKQPEQSHLVLPDPMDNFVAWRENSFDGAKMNHQQIIMQSPYEDQIYILYWDPKSEPPRRGA